MRRLVLLILLSVLIPAALCAQSSHYGEIPKFELGVQYDITYLSGVGDWGGGIGARFHYNFDEHFALDTAVTYRQHNVASFSNTIPTTGVVGQTTGLFGIRAGQRFENSGFFAHARAGFLNFGSDNGLTLLTRNTLPAFDVGATVERYSGPVILRFDLGEMIVPYGNATVFNSAPPQPLQPPPVRLGTRTSVVLGIGFAVRF